MNRTIARVVCVCQNGETHPTVEANRAAMLSYVQDALRHKPDLVCLPEAFTSAGVVGDATATAETVPGPTTDAFASLAKAHHCYILVPIHTRHGDVIHNSVVVLDRDGQVQGMYHKYCPVTSSHDYTVLENGVTPGTELPVFDLDFGRIGIQICFDLGFPENWQVLADRGARLVVWSSAYDGGFPLQVYAWLHHIWVVTATRVPRSRIVDPCGQIVAEAVPPERFVVRDVNLDTVVSHTDWNMGIPSKIKAKYGERVDVRQWIPGTSHFIVEPRDPTIRTDQLQQEFGFESATLYHNRHRRCYARLRQGERPEPQEARHGNRPQYSPE